MNCFRFAFSCQFYSSCVYWMWYGFMIYFLPQDYEARLFVLKNERGGIISSAEEAVDFQKKNSALNHFLSKLSKTSNSSTTSDISHEESKKRNVGQRVVVSYFIWLTFALGRRLLQIYYTSSFSLSPVVLTMILLFHWYKSIYSAKS